MDRQGEIAPVRHDQQIQKLFAGDVRIDCGDRPVILPQNDGIELKFRIEFKGDLRHSVIAADIQARMSEGNLVPEGNFLCHLVLQPAAFEQQWRQAAGLGIVSASH